MCGIFGITASSNSKLSTKDLEACVVKAFLESERRGKDSSGALYVSARKMILTKSQERGRDFVKKEVFRKLLKDAINDFETGETFAFFGHTRMATHGSQDLNENNQPIVSNESVVLHNGIIVNLEEIYQASPELKRKFEVDTEVIALLIESFCQNGSDETDAVILASKTIKGANTFVYFNSMSNLAFINTSNGSLYVFKDDTLGLSIFASEKQTLEGILSALKNDSLASNIYQPQINTPIILKLGNEKNTGSKRFETEIDHSKVQKKKIIQLKDSPNTLGSGLIPSQGSFRNTRITDFYSKLPNFNQITRCKLCILPTNYPFLEFDTYGVCLLCQNDVKFPKYGVDKLVLDLDAQKDSKYLIPISGGRDSCYALHFAVKELKLNVVAFTYDWGFVTDVARKNISRMCGELGVEHILVSADLKMKRKNVQKNVSAWLKKPHLGMVPIFMAGDKDFFRFASNVKEELKLTNSIFGMTRFEPAGFKTGFAKVSESGQFQKTFDLKVSNKVKLAAFYAKQAFLNPHYLNTSLKDSISGYYSYYLRKMDYLQIFDYIDWNETDILFKIRSEYGWEGSINHSNTWRIGDASAPFYNYIYSYFAGFTENDVYLSNLIRDNQITRESAMDLIEEYNLPDEVGFLKYCDLIGLSADSVLSQIFKFEGLKK
jgi:glucosamine--fructose-6-phosphate aminotransferase (isomerizing)